jgi:hypothetical protein
MPLVPTMLVLKITRGPDVLASQEITLDDGTIQPVPLLGDQIVVSDGEQTLRGTVAARDFDYTQFLQGNEGAATFVITLWADVIG